MRVAHVLVGLCGVANGQMTRSYSDFISPISGGVTILQRIPNSPAAIASMTANLTARYGFPVVVDVTPGALDTLWISYDFSLLWPVAAPFLGADWSPLTSVSDVLRGMENATVSDPSVVSKHQLVAVSPLSTYRTTNTNPKSNEAFPVGFSAYSTVYPDDPTRFVVGWELLVEDYFAIVNAKAPSEVVAVITDHTGASVVAAERGCELNDAAQVLSSTVDVTPTQQWRLQLGQCPSFTARFVANSQKRILVWVYIAVIVVGAGVFVAALLIAAFVSEKDFKLRIAMATHHESNRAHRWIIGYGALMSASCRSTRTGFARIGGVCCGIYMHGLRLRGRVNSAPTDSGRCA